MATRITERYSYKTDIITAYDGHEQRIKTRQYPRRTLSYDYDAMAPEEAQWLRAQLRLRQSDTMFIPMWHRVARLYQDFFAGRIWRIEPNDMYGFLGAEGIEVFHYDDVTGANNVNVQKIIESYAGNNIIMTSTTLTKHLNKKNTWIYPLIRCTTQPTQGLNYVFANGTTVTMNFEDVLYDGVPRLPSEITDNYRYDLVPQFNRFNLPEIYEEREVLLNNPQWVDDSSNTLSIEKLTYKADNDTGIFRYDLKNDRTYDSHSVTFLLRNRAMIDNFLKFFKKQAGMYKSFWMPSWVSDFNPVRDMNSGDNFIIVDLISLDWYYLSNGRKKKLIIFTNDWQSEIYDISTYTRITEGNRQYGKIILSRNIGKDIPLRSFRQASYLNLVRFNSDELQIDYETDDLATVNITVKEVDDLDVVS